MTNFEKISIIGNGVSAWMICAFIAEQLEHTRSQVTIHIGVPAEKVDEIQSPLPLINDYLVASGIDPQKFSQLINAHPKLGTAYLFNDKKPFFHVWGSYGAPMGPVDFHQVLLSFMQSKGLVDVNKLSIGSALVLADRHRAPSEDTNSIYSTYEQSWSFRTDDFINFLKARSLELGVNINEMKITNFEVADVRSFIFEESGAAHDCDYLINTVPDMTGAGSERESWFKSLPYERTSAIRTTNSHSKLVNKMRLIDDSSWMKETSHRETAIKEFFRFSDTDSGDSYVDIKPRKRGYLKFGPSMANMRSPLFSTLDLNLIALKLLMRYFPSPADQHSVVEEFNSSLINSFENLRDITQLCLTALFDNRVDLRSTLVLSDRAKHKLALFKRRGRLATYDNEFYKTDWQLWLLFGLGVAVENIEPLTSSVDQQLILDHVRKVENAVLKELQFAPMMSERN